MKHMNKSEVMDFIALVLLNEHYRAGIATEDEWSDRRQEYYDKVTYALYWARREAARLKDAELRRRLKDNRG